MKKAVRKQKQHEAEIDAKLDKVIDLMQKPMDFYESKKPENELDLVAVVREKMIMAGLKDKVVECYDNNRFIIEAKDRPCHAQQYHLNRFFSTQFMAAKEQAAVERYSLIYEINSKEWLEIFDNLILPAVVNYDLPVKL